jgi:hypothetical protein
MKVGGLFGVMEALESLAGFIGPAMGGLLYRAHPQLPLVTVVVIYGMLFVVVSIFYRKSIVLAHPIRSIVSETIRNDNKDIMEQHTKQS